MASAEKTTFGLAKQTAKGTPNVTDAQFKYMLFTRSQGSGAQSLTIPLDPEVGGGAMLRNIVKVGVMSGGAMEFIPRPDTLGTLLYGALGKVVSAAHAGSTVAYDHTLTFDMTDEFKTPYFTLRQDPGGLYGEQMQDNRIAALALNWRGANFVRGAVQFQGGLPAVVATTTWDAKPKVDNGPQLITPVSTIELPTGTPVKVLQGAFTVGNAIPMDQQWIVGSYSPDDFDIVSRAISLSLLVKITDATLFKKMQYDPAGGNAWAADIFREANIKLDLVSADEADTAIPYQLSIEANGSSGAEANVAWTAAPIALRAGEQVVCAMTGTFLADPTNPITCTLTNITASY